MSIYLDHIFPSFLSIFHAKIVDQETIESCVYQKNSTVHGTLSDAKDVVGILSKSMNRMAKNLKELSDNNIMQMKSIKESEERFQTLHTTESHRLACSQQVKKATDIFLGGIQMGGNADGIPPDAHINGICGQLIPKALGNPPG